MILNDHETRAEATEIEILEHLSWVIEALAENLPAEAKRELPRLLAAVERSRELDDASKTLVRGCLQATATALYKRGPAYPRDGAALLCRASRYLWQRQLDR